MKNKFIIHNYSDLSDLSIFEYISSVISKGKCSENKYGKQYSFVSEFNDGIIVLCQRRKNTYTFKIWKDVKK